MAISWEAHRDGAIEYSDTARGQLAIVRFDTDSNEFYFTHVSWKSAEWALVVRSSKLETIEFVVQAIRSEAQKGA